MPNILRRGKLLLVTSAAMAAVLTSSVAMAQAPERASGEDLPTFKPRQSETVPGEIIVKFKENAAPGAVAEARHAEGLEKKKDLDLIGAELSKVKGQSAEAAVRTLERRPNVEYATPNRKVYPSGYADEPRFSELWGLHNTGQNNPSGTPGTLNVDVNGKEASAITQGSTSLTVAVIDDGVDFTHPDLAGRQWVNPGESGLDAAGRNRATNGIDDDGNGYRDDVNGWDFFNNDRSVHDANQDSHGTHVSGTIAASVNGQGIVGVAPNVKIMALKFLGPDGRGTLADAIEAIAYAKSKGAKISNNSWGYLGPPDPALRDAINNSGQLFVAAAGNDGVDGDAGGFDSNGDPKRAGYPGGYNLPNVLSVAAIDNKGNLASFSNYGAASVDISAPGVSILSSVPTTFTGSYESWSGTSMATPHVTGTAALLASKYPALLNNPTELRAPVRAHGKLLSATAGKTVTGKMADANAVVSRPSVTFPTPITSISGRRPRIAATVKDFQTELTKSNMTISVDGVSRTSSASYDFRSDRLFYIPTTDMALGTHSVKVTAQDANGNTVFRTWSFKILS